MTQGPIVFPMIFRQLEPTMGFGWTTRIIAFIMLGVSIIPIAGMKPRVPSTQLRQIFDVALFRDTPYLLFCAAEFFDFMGVYIAFFYVQLYALANCNTSPNVAALLLPIVNAGSFFGRLVPNYLSDEFTGPMNMQIPFAFATANPRICLDRRQKHCRRNHLQCFLWIYIWSFRFARGSNLLQPVFGFRCHRNPPRNAHRSMRCRASNWKPYCG